MIVGRRAHALVGGRAEERDVVRADHVEPGNGELVHRGDELRQLGEQAQPHRVAGVNREARRADRRALAQLLSARPQLVGAEHGREQHGVIGAIELIERLRELGRRLFRHQHRVLAQLHVAELEKSEQRLERSTRHRRAASGGALAQARARLARHHRREPRSAASVARGSLDARAHHLVPELGVNARHLAFDPLELPRRGRDTRAHEDRRDGDAQLHRFTWKVFERSTALFASTTN